MKLEADGLADGLVVLAETVHPDEKAWALTETIRRTADKKEFRRFQVIWVNRNDQLAAFVRDMGPADEKTPPLHIPSQFEDSVGYLMDFADSYRNDPWGFQLMQELQESSTLIEDVQNLAERREKNKTRDLTFGAGQTTPTIHRS